MHRRTEGLFVFVNHFSSKHASSDEIQCRNTYHLWCKAELCVEGKYLRRAALRSVTSVWLLVSTHKDNRRYEAEQDGTEA